MNYFLCSLVLSLALPCARPENLELSAQVQSPQSTVAMFQFLMVDDSAWRVIFMALLTVGTIEMGSRWPEEL